MAFRSKFSLRPNVKINQQAKKESLSICGTLLTFELYQGVNRYQLLHECYKQRVTKEIGS